MITVLLDKAEFEYDIHSLVKAFYPKETQMIRIEEAETLVSRYPYDIKVAVMGCVVNGPGEAKEADLGIAGGLGCGVIIKKGEIIRKLPEEELLAGLKKELDNWQA